MGRHPRVGVHLKEKGEWPGEEDVETLQKQEIGTRENHEYYPEMGTGRQGFPQCVQRGAVVRYHRSDKNIFADLGF